MTKTVKVFGVGKWNKKLFSSKKIKDMLKNTGEKLDGIFAHSSKWKKENKETLKLGDFSNLKLSGNDLVADVEFNEKGGNYFDDGSIKGISVEMDKEMTKFTKVALLPIGVKQAVDDAVVEFEEFEDIDYLIEFEEINNNIKEGGEEMSLKEEISKLDKADKLKLAKEIVEGEGMEFQAITPEPAKTVEEIKADLRLEFEAEAEAKKVSKEAEDLIEGTVKDLKDNMQILPKDEAEFQAIAKSLDHTEKVDTLEFEEDGTTAVKKSQLQSFLEFAKSTMKSYEHLTEEHEFESKKEKKTDLQEIQDKINGKK